MFKGEMKTMSKKILNNPLPISTQLEKEDAEYFQRLAYENHASVSQMVRNILLEYKEDNEWVII